MSDTFGITDLGSIDDPGLTGTELAHQLDQAFTSEVRQKRRPAARTAKRVTQMVTPPVVHRQASKNPPRAGFSAGSASKKAPAKPALRLNPETGTFTIQQVDIPALDRKAAEEKIVNTLRIPPKLRTAFLNKLKANQEAIAEFLFLEVATFDLAVPASVEILNEYLADSIDVGTSAELGRVSGMLSKLSDLRTLEFLCKLCRVSKANTDMMVRDMLAPPPERQRAVAQPRAVAHSGPLHQQPPKRQGPSAMDRVGMRNALSGLLNMRGD